MDKYKEAIERLKQWDNEHPDGGYSMQERDEFIFPELKENEDEKIRKELIKGIERCSEENILFNKEVSKSKVLAWLEKQGEQKSLDDVAKEVTKDKETAISFLKSCGIMNANGELADEYKIEQGEQKPAEWGEEDENISEAIINYLNMFKGNAKSKIEKALEDSRIIWVHNLKHRISSSVKSAEWSEEDKKLIDDTCNLINTLASGYGTTNVTEPITFAGSQMIANIKSKLRALVGCRSQNHWKPSEEQIVILTRAINNPYLTTDEYNGLVELRNDLKKLK